MLNEQRGKLDEWRTHRPQYEALLLNDAQDKQSNQFTSNSSAEKKITV